MPHRDNDSKHVLPPVSRHNGSYNNRQPIKSNHGVSLPPIQDNNKITNGNNISQDDRTRQTNSNVGEQRSNTRHTGYDDERKNNDYNRKRRSRSRSKSAEKNRDRKSENRPHSKSHSRNRNRSAERSKKNDRRSRSRDKKKRDPSHDRRKSRSKSRGRTRRRSRSRESSRHRKTHESRRRSKSKENRRRSKSRHNVRHRSRSHDRRSRQRSKDRSSSREKHRTRGQSRTRSKNYRQNKSRSRSRDRDEQGHKSHSKRDKYRHSSRSSSRDRKYRHKTRSQTTERDHKHGSKSGANKSKYRSSSSEYRDDKRRQRKSKDNRNYLKSKEYELYSGDDSSDSEAFIPTVIYSRRERHSDKDFHKSKRETTLKSKSRSRKHKSKRASGSDSEKNYNVIVLENGQSYISSSDEDSSNRKTIYVRSKSEHAVRLNGKLQKSKDYYSDADTYKTFNDRNVIYVNEEPKEIIVAPRNRLNVQRATTHVNPINVNASMQPENEELFYLVPASYHTINNPPPSQENAIFVNQPTAPRVVRMSNPAPQTNTKQQTHYVNKSDAVYGQEPLYDEYRQHAQQKFYNQHTNHYRHDNRVSENIDVNIVTSEDNHIRNTQNNKDYHQNTGHEHSSVTGNLNVTNQIPNARDTGRTPDGESNSSLGHSPTNSDVSQVSTKPEIRVNTAERRRALKHLNELSNYNIDVAMGKTTLHPPPMTDENLIKKIFNAEFQSQMDDYLRA